MTLLTAGGLDFKGAFQPKVFYDFSVGLSLHVEQLTYVDAIGPALGGKRR